MSKKPSDVATGAGATALDPGAGLTGGIAGLILEVQAHGIAPWAPLLPPRVAAVFRVFVMSLTACHPLVLPVFWKAATGLDYPRQPDRGDVDDEKVSGQIVQQLVKGVPWANERRLEERAKSAVEEARRTFAPDGEVRRPVHAWTTIACALCVEAIALGPVEAAAAAHALASAADLVADLDDEASELRGGPAPTLVARIVSEVARSIVLDYLRAVRSAASPAAARRSPARDR